MSSILAISGRDLKAYFSSPKAATIFAFFLIFMGFFFNNFIHMFMQMQQQAPMMGGQAPTIEQLLRALFYNVHFNFKFILIFHTRNKRYSLFSKNARAISWEY